MKTGYLILIALILWTAPAGAQYGYQYVSGGYWFGAQFIGQEGWMVGKNGLVHTRDGGGTWINQPLPTYSRYGLYLGDVRFVDQRHGWVCPMEIGVNIWRTTDGGRTWAADSLPRRGYSFNYTSKMAFVDTLHGWLVGGWWGYVEEGNIIATTDGGRTWTLQDTSHSWFGVAVRTTRRCWAVGKNGWAGFTTDGGATWTNQQIPPNKTLRDVSFPDTLFGWACGDSGAIVHTTDGGVSWSSQTSGTDQGLAGIVFLDRNRGFAVGDSGAFLKTTDGGTSWTSLTTGLTPDWTAITFGDSLRGWIIGEGGTTLETTDRGQTWRLTRQGTTERVQALSFADDQTGWYSTWEGKIWGTQDGGRFWTKQASVSPKRLRGLVMANALRGWAVGDSGLILTTQNGGATWVPQASGTGRNLWNVFSNDVQHAWACGAGKTVVQTSNGGSTWNNLNVAWPDSGFSGFASAETLFGWALFKDGNVWTTTNSGRSWGPRGRIRGMGWRHLSFVDPQWGWAVGDSGIVRSTDGGRTWQAQGPSYRMRDVDGRTQMKAWAVGDSGRILATTDGGASWFPQDSHVVDPLVSISFADTLHGIVGNGGMLVSYPVLVTRNGGAVWDTVLSQSDTKDVFLVDSLYGWQVAGGGLSRTIDGGYTWQSVRNDWYLTAVHFANRDTGWVGSSNGTILSTTDGGTTWNTLGQYRDSLYDVRLVNGRVGWCGLRINRWWPTQFLGNLLMTTFDRGDSWYSDKLYHATSETFKAGSPISSETGCFVGSWNMALRTGSDLSWDLVPMLRETLLANYRTIYPRYWDLDFADGQTGWAVGQNGSGTITRDGGTNWEIQHIPPPYSTYPDLLLTSIHAYDGLTVRATGYLGRSVLTTDGGNNWVTEERGTWEWLLASSFLTPTLGWVAGEDGMVLKYGRLPYGVEEGEKTPGVPRVTWLGPNHPNPFSGGTDIKYQLASRGKARLGVYNVLGQVVRELVSGEQEAGTYVIRWDGKDGTGKATSSGVYFYRLEAFGQSQIRKMVKVR